MQANMDQSRTAEQELQVLRREFIHGDLVFVDRGCNHVGLLFLQLHHSALHTVLDN